MNQMTERADGGRNLPERTRPRLSPIMQMSARFSIEPEKLMNVLKGTVIKPTDKHEPTNEEVAAFVIVANQYGLNPFTREIHAFADPRRGVVPIVGIDGWSHIVNKEEQFDGCDFEDEADEDGRCLSITCTMHVKGRGHPTRVRERYEECYRNTPPWNTMPWRMLRHKAFMQAARLAFSISGLYDDDEARDIIDGAVVAEAGPVQQRGAAATAERLKAQRTPEQPPPREIVEGTQLSEDEAAEIANAYDLNDQKPHAESAPAGATTPPVAAAPVQDAQPDRQPAGAVQHPFPPTVPDSARGVNTMIVDAVDWFRPKGPGSPTKRRAYIAFLSPHKPKSWEAMTREQQDELYASLINGRVDWAAL
jgi:phage recombination protein Bet